MARRSRDTLKSNTYRFFVEPAAFAGEQVKLTDADLARQMAQVLRLEPGDQVMLLDGAGWQYAVTLERIERGGAIAGKIERREAARGEPALNLTLYLPLMRAERFEWALQKGVELGVMAITPTLCAHSAESIPDARKLSRWRRIIREAAEQSRRGRLPHLEAPIPFHSACAQAANADRALLLWEGDNAPPLMQVLRQTGRQPQSLALLSGPEGGITPEERQIASEHGIMSVSLGPRTLRAETAPIAAIAATMYEYGEWE